MLGILFQHLMLMFVLRTGDIRPSSIWEVLVLIRMLVWNINSSKLWLFESVWTLVDLLLALA